MCNFIFKCNIKRIKICCFIRNHESFTQTLKCLFCIFNVAFQFILIIKLTLGALFKILTQRWWKFSFNKKSFLNSQIQKTIKGFV